MRTHAALWQMMVEDYDFCGKSIVIGHSPGVYDGIDCRGRLLGAQQFAGQIHFIGDRENPANVLIQPISGNAVHVMCGANVYVDGFKLDMSHSPNDMVTVEEESGLIFGKCIIGSNHGHHDFQVCVNGRLNLIEDYIIDKGSSVGLCHLQQDPSSRISVAGDGKFGFLHVKVIGAPQYIVGFCWVDRADGYLQGAAWMGEDLVKTTFDRGTSPLGAGCVPVASVDGIRVGHMAVSPVLSWGTVVTSVDVPNRIVCLSRGIIDAATTGLSIAFASRPQGYGPRYRVTNGGLIASNTDANHDGGTDYNWFPGSLPGVTDGFPGSCYK